MRAAVRGDEPESVFGHVPVQIAFDHRRHMRGELAPRRQAARCEPQSGLCCRLIGVTQLPDFVESSDVADLVRDLGTEERFCLVSLGRGAGRGGRGV